MDQKNSAVSAIPPQDPKVRRGARRWLRREVLGNLFLVLLIFLAAGRWDWPMGWALCGIYLVWSLATALLVLPVHPEMLAERAVIHPDRRSWDLALLTLLGVFMLAEYLVASLDLRFGWTQAFSLPLQAAGLLAAFIGYDVLLVWSMVANAFFVTTVRIQSERGQQPVSSGPYRFVRHPGYLGTVLLHLGVPFMLNSAWALIPGLLIAAVMAVRTRLEDQALQKELPGYPEYAARVRWRLLPGVW